MRIYKVHFQTESDSSQGFDFYTNKKIAEVAIRIWEKNGGGYYTELEVIETDGKLPSIVKLLQRHAAHPDNG